MILNLEKLKSGRNEFWRTYSAAELGLGKGRDFTLNSDVETHIVAIKSKNNVKLTLEASYTLRLTCSRCLEEFDRKFDEKVTYYLKAGKEELVEEKSLAEEDIFTMYYATEELDIRPLVREIIILSVPMKPLCKPDCKGLCPVCGVNWNYETCEHMHQEQKIDARWKKLLEISTKLK